MGLKHRFMAVWSSKNNSEVVAGIFFVFNQDMQIIEFNCKLVTQIAPFEPKEKENYRQLIPIDW